jgi:tetratricopeptide (TPR) repeat protein
VNFAKFQSAFVCISLCVAAVGCATSAQEKKVPTGLGQQEEVPNSGTLRAQELLNLADKKQLQGQDADEAFLLAETLIQEKQFEAAGKLLSDLFRLKPTLVVGLKLARLQTLSGETSQAEAAVRKLLLLYPKSPEPSLALAFLEQIRGSREEAIATLEKAYYLHPRNEEVAARYSEILLEAGKKDKAKSTLLEASMRMPESTYFLLRLARLRTEDGNFKEAKNLLDRLLRIDPQNTDAWMLAGYIATEEKNNEEAERYFREAYEKQPENDVLAKYYVGQLLRQEKYPEARRLLSRLEQSADDANPLDPELTFQLAYAHFQMEEYAEAKKRFESLIDKSPDKGRMIFFVGQCDELLKNKGSAFARYSQVETSSEFYGQARQRIIVLKLDDAAAQDVNADLKLYRDTMKGEEGDFRFLAAIEARLKRFKEAAETVESGLKKYPESAELLYLRAAYKEQLESKESSLRALEVFLKKFPNHAQALNHLGYSLAEQKTRLDEAEGFLKKAIKTEPKNGFYLDSLGWVYAQKGQWKLAEKYLLQALQEEPDEPIILEHLGEVKFRQGETALALRYFERAQQMFEQKPKWKLDSDEEWKASFARVQFRVKQLRDQALGVNRGQTL